MALGSVLTPFCLVGLGTMLVTLLCLLLLLLLLLLLVLSLGTDFLRAVTMVWVSRLPGGAECRLVECLLLELELVEVASLSWFFGRRWLTPSPSANSTHKKLEEFRFGSSSAEEEEGESTQVSSPYASYEG